MLKLSLKKEHEVDLELPEDIEELPEDVIEDIKQELEIKTEEIEETNPEEIKTSLEFTEEEDEYIRISSVKFPVSRIAFKLNRDYDDVELRMVKLGIVNQKNFERRIQSKFASKDEIDYQLLLMGHSEVQIRNAHERARVIPSKISSGAIDESYD